MHMNNLGVRMLCTLRAQTTIQIPVTWSVHKGLFLAIQELTTETQIGGKQTYHGSQ